MAESALPFPTKTRTAFAREVHAGRIRWYRHETPGAHHTMTGRKHTADLDELVNADLARIPPCDPGLSAIAELTPEGVRHFGLAEGPGSTSPEPGPPTDDHSTKDGEA